MRHSKKVIPTLRRGSLGVHFTSPSVQRHRRERALAKKIGEKKVVGKLVALEVLNKRRNPTLSLKAKQDAHYIAGSFKGRKEVKYPKGFGRNK